MKFHWSYYIFYGLIFLLQLNHAQLENEEQIEEEDHLLVFQLKVENLIEKIINFVKDYYYEFKNDLKCIPDNATTSMLEIIKKAIDCIEENERGFNNDCHSEETHTTNFQKCFMDAKNEIKETINSINASIIQCPNNITEKTYQINITTTFTKTFNIDIKNGVEITRKELNLRKNKNNCGNVVTDVTYWDESFTQAPDDQSEENSTTAYYLAENEEGEETEETMTRRYHGEGERKSKKTKLLSQFISEPYEDGYEGDKYLESAEPQFPHRRIPVMDSRKIQRFNLRQKKFLDLFDSFERR